MNTVGARIRKIRDKKCITQDSMAHELDIFQSNYGRLEKDDKRLTVPKLTKIAEVLNVSVAILFGEKANHVITEHHGDFAQNGTLINNSTEHITSLKDENKFLKEQIIFLNKIIENK